MAVNEKVRPILEQLEKRVLCVLFFFNDTATTEIYTLSLHDALPISDPQFAAGDRLSNARCALSGATSSHPSHGSSSPSLVSLMQPLCPGTEHPSLPPCPLSLARRGPSYPGLFVVYPNSKRAGR